MECAPKRLNRPGLSAPHRGPFSMAKTPKTNPHLEQVVRRIRRANQGVTRPALDATGHVGGRLASIVAKRERSGEEIVIVNAEKALVLGQPSVGFEQYRARHQRGSTASRMRGIGPNYPRRPDMILRRTISRMMPYQQPRGRTALKRLRVYLSVPDEFKEKPLETIEVAKRPPQGPYMSLGEIATLLGSKFGGSA